MRLFLQERVFSLLTARSWRKSLAEEHPTAACIQLPESVARERNILLPKLDLLILAHA